LRKFENLKNTLAGRDEVAAKWAKFTIAEWFVKFANRSTATSTLVSHGVSLPPNL